MLRASARVSACAAVVALAALGACSGSDASPPGDGASCPNDLPVACPTPPPSYAKDIAPIIGQTCATCHVAGGPQADRPLATYEELHASRSAALNQIHACKMPPVAGSPLTANERLLLQTWLVCGAPDN